MKSIYKYPLSGENKQVLLLPVGIEILTVQMQGENACLWAMVNIDEQRLVSRHIVTFDGDDSISDNRNLKYIGTYEIPEYLYSIEPFRYGGDSVVKNELKGYLMFHVFEELN